MNIEHNINIDQYSQENQADLIIVNGETFTFKATGLTRRVFANADKTEGELFNEKLAHIKTQKKLAIKDLDKLNLKLELHTAVTDSYDEAGIFWKDNGWSNISDVLVKNKLLKLEE